MPPVYLTPTIDCEPPNPTISEKARKWSPTGPKSYEESEKAIRGFMDVCKKFELRPTYFVHPELAVEHSNTLSSLISDGACVGMHLHPFKMNTKYDQALGAYSAEKQRMILGEAVDLWEEGLGHKPNYFRAGGISLNDNTFQILEEVGFEGGSTSLPGYVNPPRCINWAGAERYIHRANLNYRQNAGDGHFVEVPYVPDFSRPRHGTKGPRHQGYERLEIIPNGSTTKQDLRSISRNILDQILEDAPELMILMSNAHNNFDYSDENDPQRENLEFMFATMQDAVEERNLDPTFANIETIIEDYRSRSE